MKILGEVRAKREFLLIGYVSMPEHVHPLISEPKRLTPSRMLQILKQRVSRKMRGIEGGFASEEADGKRRTKNSRPFRKPKGSGTLATIGWICI